MEMHRTSKIYFCLAYKALLQAKKKMRMWEQANSKESGSSGKIESGRDINIGNAFGN